MAEKKTTTKATGKSRSQSKKAAEEQRLREEALARSLRSRRIGSVILMALGAALLLIAFIPGGEGEGWRALFDVMHGLFGFGAYAVGPVMIYAAVMISAKKPKNTIAFMTFKTVLLIIMLCAASEIFASDGIRGENFGEIIANLYNNGKEFKGGGVFAIILGVPLLLLGKFGAVVIIILVGLVCVFLMSNLSPSELFEKLGAYAGNAKGAASERIQRRKEESAIAEEEYRRLEEERRAQKQLQKEERRMEEELRRQEKFESLKKAVHSVNDDEEPSDKAYEPETEKKERTKTGIKFPEPAETKDIIEEQKKESRDYHEALKAYMEKRHPIMRDPVKPSPDRLEDTDGELEPIIDALDKFNMEHSAPARVSKIVDAPKEMITTSDEKPSPPLPEILTSPAPPRNTTDELEEDDDGELPFDLDDIMTETKKAEETTGSVPSLSDVYTLPPASLLNPVKKKVAQADIDSEIRKNAIKLVDTLKSFGVSTTYTGAARGPSVTRYELQPAPGVKISKISNLADDIALNLATSGVRIAPVPNKAAVGIEIPNDNRDTVYFRELVDTPEFKKTFDKKLVSVLGKDISGATVTCNISKMPHLLIAGTTGSGKSVCVNSIIMSILMKSTPKDVRLIMVDPKQVEFMMYNGIPHLLIPVVTDPKKAAGALAWSVTEMENRYTLFSENNVRNIDGYNELADNSDGAMERMPHIVIFIDELADLMMASPKDVEDSIVRLAQKARAAGMYLVIATQKPTVQVVTGLIKGNIPSRIALMVASQVDSRVILDGGGAEKLLGNGDMLYMPVGSPKPIRLQGCYVSDDEVERVVEFIKQTFSVEYDEDIMAEIERQSEIVGSNGKNDAPEESPDDEEADEKLEDAIELVVSAGQASTSALQRNLKLGYGRAARLIDTMEKMGIVGPFEGAKPRQVLMTRQEWYERKMRSN